MENPFDEMRRALREANSVMTAADQSADDMAAMLEGRLRHVKSWHLKALKRELANYNISTRTWKD